MPLLSVLIPTFNPGEKLAKSLDSGRALGLENGELQIIVQDGGSTDGTAQFLASQNDVSWQSEPDGGVFDAMNRALSRADGDWLLFLGAGDVLRPNILRDGQLRAALENARENLALVYGDAWLCEENFRYGGPFSRLKLRSWVPSHQAIFYNRRVFERWGGYELNYPIAADYALNLRCWGDGEIEKIYVGTLVCDYEGRGLSKTVRDENFERDKMRLIRERLGFDAYALRCLELLTPRFLKDWRVAILQKRAKEKNR